MCSHVLPDPLRKEETVSSLVIRECMNGREKQLVVPGQSLLPDTEQHRPSASSCFPRLSCLWSWGPSQLPLPFLQLSQPTGSAEGEMEWGKGSAANHIPHSLRHLHLV